MAKRKPMPGVRICGVCGKPGADAGFRQAMFMLGVANWKQDKAHIRCITRIKRTRAEQKAQQRIFRDARMGRLQSL